MQDAVKNTEILIPFIFYDGTNIPAGTVKVKKGDPVWLFLDRCRKVGAELGVGGNSGATKGRKDNRREWARVSVDDLMLVKGDIIVPHVRAQDSGGHGSKLMIPALRAVLLYRQPRAQLFAGWGPPFRLL